MRNFALLVLVVLFSGWGSGASAAPINSGLVAGYEFNGNADDVSGNGNDGVVNGATLTTDRFGNANSAYSFDGSNQTISIPETSGFEDNALTLSVWVDMVAFSTNGIRSDVIGKDGVERQWVLQLEQSGKVRGAVFTTSGEHTFDSLETITTNSWHHLAYVWDGTTASIFINGDFDSSISVSGDMASGSQPVTFGSNPPHFTNYLNGSLDDAYIFNRALSGSEIQTLYSAVPEPNTALLVGFGLVGLGVKRRTRRGC